MTRKAFYQHNPYLDDWKREIDDDSINKDVLALLTKKKFKRVLDIGTGSGAQIRRDIELGLIRNNGEIIGLDVNEEGLTSSIVSFRRWAKKKSFSLEEIADSSAIHKFLVNINDQKYTVSLYCASVYDLGTRKTNQIGNDFDLVTGLSLLEHTDMKRALQSIKKVMKRGAYLYLPVNYDQHTTFGPTPKNFLEKEPLLMQLFNYVGIDMQFKGEIEIGNSQCGSLLPTLCMNIGFTVLAYGSSDWVIPPGRAINYSENKRNVLGFFVDAFYEVFKSADSKVQKKFGITNDDIKNWQRLRKKQLQKGELYFTCMQKDILCRRN